MNEKSYLKINFDSSFLSGDIPLQKKDVFPFFSHFREIFEATRAGIIAVQNSQPATFEFNKDDLKEIARYESYRFTNMDKSQGVTLNSLRNHFASMGLTDTSRQNLILQLILQTRASIPFSIFNSISSLPLRLWSENPKALEEYQTNIAVANIPEHDNATYSLSHDCETNISCLIVHQDLVYTKIFTESKFPIGQANLKILIDANNAIKIDSMYGIIDPLEELRKRFADEEILSDLKACLNFLSKQLKIGYQQSLETEHVPEETLEIEPTVQETQRTQSSRTWGQWVKNNPWKTIGIISGLTLFAAGISLVATGVASPLGVILAGIGIKGVLPVSIGTGILFSIFSSVTCGMGASLTWGVKKFMQWVSPPSPAPLIKHDITIRNSMNSITQQLLDEYAQEMVDNASPTYDDFYTVNEFTLFPGGTISQQQIIRPKFQKEPSHDEHQEPTSIHPQPAYVQSPEFTPQESTSALSIKV